MLFTLCVSYAEMNSMQSLFPPSFKVWQCTYCKCYFSILTKQRPLVVLEICHSQSPVRETGHSSVAFVF